MGNKKVALHRSTSSFLWRVNLITETMSIPPSLFRRLKYLFLFLLFCGTEANAQINFTENYPDSVNRKRLALTIGTKAVTYFGGISYLSFIWYKDHERTPFHYYDDTKGYLQMDKWGHAFTAYRESYAAYHALRWSGLSKKKALLYGGPMGLIFQTPIEVLDGMYEGWGFSWSDMGANAFGSALFVAQEVTFDEQIVLMKFSYSPSPYAKLHPTLGETHLESLFQDYNAHTYWLSFNLQKMTVSEKLPKWLNLAFGYSANGMIFEFFNPDFHDGKDLRGLVRHRQYLFSLDVDFSRIQTRKKWLQKVFRAVNLVKVPFPALEWNKVERFRVRPFYF